MKQKKHSVETTKQKGLSPRGKARLVTFVVYIITLLGLGLGNFKYYLMGAHHDRSGDQVTFMVLTLIGLAFVTSSLKIRWLAIGSCLIAVIGFIGTTTYPLTTSLSSFWGQALALVCYMIAFVSSFIIITASAE